MPDTPQTPDTDPVQSPPATQGTPNEAAPAGPAAAAAPSSRPEPSVSDTSRLLAEHFPALFGAGVIKPIKLRIQADIDQRAPGVFTRKALSVFLHRYTTGTAYLRALVAEGATRIDLDGQPAGEISAEHRDAAAAELERRRAIVEAKKQAGREAARASRQDARPPRPSQRADVSQPASPATDERSGSRAARPQQSGTSDRTERPPRPNQAGPSPRRSRPPHPGVQRGPKGPGDTGAEALRRPHKPVPEHGPAHAKEQAPVKAPALPLTPEQAAEAEARQQRALLLRSFEQSPLSKANFGALKGLSEAALEALLAQARQERGQR